LDNQHPKNSVIYKGRTLPGIDGYVPMDVRHLVFFPDAQLSSIIEKQMPAGLSSDRRATWAEEWVTSRIRYKPDAQEFWMSPAETLFAACGDCEDIAILLASLLLNTGVEAHRVKVAAGTVNYGNNTYPHTWALYYRDSGSWVALDPQFYQTPEPIADRPKMKDNPFYTGIFFTFNHLNSWAHRSVTIPA